jgi:uncharacterized membrane-anchored protein YitT (DUF2179 family)
LFRYFKWKPALIALLGSAILAFGLYHIHAFSGVTEGGQLGLCLLLQHWFQISPAVTALAVNIICYLIGFKTLGWKFVTYSAISALGFSGTYWLCQQFPTLFPGLAELPLLAAVLGALFVGVGTGLCVRVGGAASGDDALAMSLSHRLKIKIEYVYFISDFAVLALSLTYIPLSRILYSVLTVTLSSWLVGFIQRLNVKGSASA